MKKQLTFALAAMLLSMGVMAQGRRTMPVSTASPAQWQTEQTLPSLSELTRPVQTLETPFMSGAAHETVAPVHTPAPMPQQLVEHKKKQAQAEHMLQLVLRAPQQAMTVSQPTNLAIDYSVYGQLTLSWDAASDAAGFHLMLTNSSNIGDVVRDTLADSIRTITYENIFLANSYTLYLEAFDSEGNRSGWSSCVANAGWGYYTWNEIYLRSFSTDIHLVMEDGSTLTMSLPANSYIPLPDFDYAYLDIPESARTHAYCIYLYNNATNCSYYPNDFVPGQPFYFTNTRPGDVLASEISSAPYINGSGKVSIGLSGYVEYAIRRGRLTPADMPTVQTIYGNISGVIDQTPAFVNGVLYTLAIRQITDAGPSSWEFYPLYNEISIGQVAAEAELTAGPLPLSVGGRLDEVGRIMDFDATILLKGFVLEEASTVHLEADMFCYQNGDMMNLGISQDAYGSSSIYMVEASDSTISADITLEAGTWYVFVSGSTSTPYQFFDLQLTATPLPLAAPAKKITQLPFADSGVISEDDDCWVRSAVWRMRSYTFTVADTTQITLLLEAQGDNSRYLYACVADKPMDDLSSNVIGGVSTSNFVGYNFINLLPGTYYLYLMDGSTDMIPTPYHMLISTYEPERNLRAPQRLVLNQPKQASMLDQAAVTHSSGWYCHPYTFTLGQETAVDIVLSGDSLFSGIVGMYLSNANPFREDTVAWYDYSFSDTLSAGTYYLEVYSEIRNCSYTIEVMEHAGWEYDYDNMQANVSGSFSASNDYHRDLHIDASPINICRCDWSMAYRPACFIVNNSFVAGSTSAELSYRFRGLDVAFSPLGSYYYSADLSVYDAAGNSIGYALRPQGVITLSGLTVGATYYVEAYSTFSPFDLEMWLSFNLPFNYAQLTVPAHVNLVAEDMIPGNYGGETDACARYQFTADDQVALFVRAADNDVLTLQYGTDISTVNKLYDNAYQILPAGSYYMTAFLEDTLPAYVSVLPIDRDTDVVWNQQLKLGESITKRCTPGTQSAALLMPDNELYDMYEAYTIHLEKGHIYMLNMCLTDPTATTEAEAKIYLMTHDTLKHHSADVRDYEDVILGLGRNLALDYLYISADSTIDYRVLVGVRYGNYTSDVYCQLQLTEYGADDLEGGISIDSACNMAPTIQYRDLPVRHDVTLSEKSSVLVKGLTQESAYVYIIRVVVPAGQTIRVEQFMQFDSYMHIFQKNLDGTWTQVGQHDDNGRHAGGSVTSEWDVQTPSGTTEYAFVTRSYKASRPHNEGYVYYTHDVIEVIELFTSFEAGLNYENLVVEILASENNLHFAEGTDEAAVRERLAQITLQLHYAVYLGEMLAEEMTLGLPNIAEMWEVDMLNGQARFVLEEMNNTEVVIYFTIGTGLEAVETEARAQKYLDGQHIYIRTADGRVYNMMGVRVR